MLDGYLAKWCGCCSPARERVADAAGAAAVCAANGQTTRTQQLTRMALIKAVGAAGDVDVT
jgi:hypothetical protein